MDPTDLTWLDLTGIAWVAAHGVLTLQGTSIEIRREAHRGIPYVLYCPHKAPAAYWLLENAQSDGERCYAELKHLDSIGMHAGTPL